MYLCSTLGRAWGGRSPRARHGAVQNRLKNIYFLCKKVNTFFHGKKNFFKRFWTALGLPRATLPAQASPRVPQKCIPSYHSLSIWRHGARASDQELGCIAGILSGFVGFAGMLPGYAANLRNSLCGVPPGVRRSRGAIYIKDTE